MGREILFKAKRIDNGEWVEGYYVKGTKYPSAIFINIDSEIPECFDFEEIDENTICQYTGLTDNTKWEDLTEEEKQKFYDENCSEDGKTIKYQHIENVKHLWKGKKIWENDVVKLTRNVGYKSTKGGRFKVYFNNFLCHFALSFGHRENEAFDYMELSGKKACIIEVIGNIFDNPELLEG